MKQQSTDKHVAPTWTHYPTPEPTSAYSHFLFGA